MIFLSKEEGEEEKKKKKLILKFMFLILHIHAWMWKFIIFHADMSSKQDISKSLFICWHGDTTSTSILDQVWDKEESLINFSIFSFGPWI